MLIEVLVCGCQISKYIASSTPVVTTQNEDSTKYAQKTIILKNQTSTSYVNVQEFTRTPNYFKFWHSEKQVIQKKN